MASSIDQLQVLVTGCSGGVGASLVAHHISKGHRVFGVDVVPSTLAQADSIDFMFSKCDLKTGLGITQTVEISAKFLSRIDMLVHAAGVFFSDAELSDDATKLRAMWDCNFFAAAELTSKLLPLVRKGHAPLVVFISSADAIVASGGQACEVGVAHDIGYATTKGALITLTRALAMKLAKDGIRVNALCPTIIRTPMCDSLLARPGKEHELSAHIPLGRICEPHDIVVAVECLYSLRMTTAHVLPVDGGYLCR